MKNFIKNKIEKHPKLWEIFKFLLVGGTATIIDFAVMGLVLFAFDPELYDNNFLKAFFGGDTPMVYVAVLATAAGFIVSLMFNYFLSVLFVFTGVGNSTAKAKTKKGFTIFALLAGIGLFIHSFGMWLGYGQLEINEWLVKIVLTIVVLFFNYFTRKKFIFHKKKVENNNK